MRARLHCVFTERIARAVKAQSQRPRRVDRALDAAAKLHATSSRKAFAASFRISGSAVFSSLSASQSRNPIRSRAAWLMARCCCAVLGEFSMPLVSSAVNGIGIGINPKCRLHRRSACFTPYGLRSHAANLERRQAVSDCDSRKKQPTNEG